MLLELSGCLLFPILIVPFFRNVWLISLSTRPKFWSLGWMPPALGGVLWLGHPLWHVSVGYLCDALLVFPPLAVFPVCFLGLFRVDCLFLFPGCCLVPILPTLAVWAFRLNEACRSPFYFFLIFYNFVEFSFSFVITA